ncbi:glycosyltransferase family 4 protein [Dermacoccaceae bacterium W4C1]
MTTPAMRVAYVCADPGVPVFGTKGASVHVQEMLRSWRRRGAEVRLYCTRTGDHVPDDLADIPVTHVRVPKLGDGGTAAREQAQAQAAEALALQVLADGVDLVHERYSLFSRALSRIVASSPAGSVRALLEVNSPLIEEQETHRELVDRAAADAVVVAQAGAADRVLAVSEPVGQWVTGRQPRALVRVCPNGVNVDRIRPAVAADPGEPVVVFVGTLKPWHGTDVLLEAAALARRPWRVRIVGDGPQALALRQRAWRLGLDVDFRGAVPPEQVPLHLDGATVAVAPYPDGQDQYFSPLKVLEYAAAGLPVVASRVGQLEHLVPDGITGVLVPPSDPRALAGAIDALVARPDRAARMGARGRRLVVEQHTWDQVLHSAIQGIEPSVRTGLVVA